MTNHYWNKGEKLNLHFLGGGKTELFKAQTIELFGLEFK